MEEVVEYQLSGIETERIQRITGIEIYYVDLQCEFRVLGAYRAATFHDPAEYPELEIHSIQVLSYDNKFEVPAGVSDIIADQIDWGEVEELLWKIIDK
jgi:hypothetical protein